MNVFISGGAGFIGSHIASTLVSDGHKITVFDNLSTGKRSNIADIQNLNFIQGDIRDLSALKTAMKGHNIVCHQAALVSVPQSIKDPSLNHSINMTGFLNILEAAREVGVNRVVYASSAAVYGNHPELPKSESSPIQPIAPYATAKYMNELYAELYTRLYNLECVGLRYMNVYGPKQDPSSPYSGVLSIFCHKLLNQSPILVFGDGEQTRDFVYVADVVQANILAMTANLPHQKSVVFNVGNGKPISLNSILAQLQTQANHKLEIIYKPERSGDIKHSYANISLAQKQLSYSPQTSLKQGLSKTVAWFQQTTK